MHALYEVTDDDVAIPCFGLNAPERNGALFVISRTGSDPALVGILQAVPSGQLTDDQAIRQPVDANEMALVMATIPEESGFVVDGVNLHDLQYVYIKTTGTVQLDISFIPNRVPVDIGKPGGFV